MISKETLEQIVDRASLVEIIGEAVALKRSGSGFSGLCPFHSEKTPSFHIRDSDSRYHCFGCGASGDVFTYMMESRGLSFPEAVEALAVRYGIDVQRDSEGPRQFRDTSNKKELFAINQLANDYFRDSLRNAPEVVNRYLTQRGLSSNEIDQFGIGFAPAGWSGLTGVLREHGYQDDLLLKSGLVRRSSKGELYDGFRARLIFPIAVEKNRVVAFGGRTIPELIEQERAERIPKYINSPETAIYKKNKTLYALPQALPAIREQRSVYLVEGYMDVIGLWRAGVRHCVATCGTAITHEHVQRLVRLVPGLRVVLLFDGDSAGRAAAAKSFSVFLNSGIDVYVLFLKEGEDPDSLAAAHAESTAQYLEQQSLEQLFTSFLRWTVAKYGADSARALGAAARGKLAREIAALLSKVSNPVERSLLLEESGTLLGVNTAQIGQMLKGEDQAQRVDDRAMNNSSGLHEPVGSSEAKGFPAISELPKLDQVLLSAVMADRGLISRALENSLLHLHVHSATQQFLIQLREVCTSALEQTTQKEQVSSLLKACGQSWILHWRASHAMAAERSVNVPSMLEECLQRVQERELKRLLGEIDHQLEECHDEGERTRLTLEKVELNRRRMQA